MATIKKRGRSCDVIYYSGEGKDRKQVWDSGLTRGQANTRKLQIEYEESIGIKTHPKPAMQNASHPVSMGAAVGQVSTGILGESTAEAGMPLSTFMEEFIHKHGTVKWGDSYFKSSQADLKNYIYPYWGKDTPITEFTTRKIDNYYVWLVTECPPVCHKHSPKKRKKCVTPSKVADIHKLMRTAFNKAVVWEKLEVNPFLKATVPEYKSEERPALTPSQLEKVLEYTDKPHDYALFVIHCAINLAFAGSMRGGEVGGLQWSDIVDPERQILYIHKTIARVDKETIKKTIKTKIYFTFPSNPRSKSLLVLKNTKEDGGSDRNCYLPKAVYQRLLRLREMQDELKEECGAYYQDFGMIICQADGRPYMMEHLNKKFQAVLAEMGIKPPKDADNYVFHSIRSTSTTYKLRISGGDIKAVQGETGHKDPKMVTNQYARILAEDRERISERMNDDFYRSEEKKSEQEQIMDAVTKNPELLAQFMAFVSANKSAKKTGIDNQYEKND